MHFLSSVLLVCVSLCLLTCVSVRGDSSTSSAVLKLDPTNFDAEVGGSLPVFVEFFAPWCGHCKALAPEYEVLAASFVGQPVKIASVDADAHRELGSRFGVTGFPTLKFFPAGSQEGESYSGGRSASDMIDFINTKVGTHVKLKTAPSAVTVLDPDNFASIVKDSSKDVLVEFYAPWCGHCKQLAPVYEKVAQSFEGENDVVVAKLDADKHRELAGEYGISGYPTLKWFPRYNKQGEDYTGGRAAEDFVNFINQHSHTQRTVGGGFTEEAGTLPILMGFVENFKTATDQTQKRDALKQLEEAIASSVDVSSSPNAEFAKFYSLFMKKALDDPTYIDKEIDRLQRMLKGGNVNAKNRAQFSKRINIAMLFQ